MMALQPPLAVAGRILLAALFLPSGIAKLTGPEATIGFIASKGLPMPALLTVSAAALEISASIAILLGWKIRWAALALAVFTLLAAVLFHDWWASPPQWVMFQRLAFNKNLGIAGGLLLLAALGPGPLTIEKDGNENHRT
jgi:putative oxidoreductase